MTTVRNSPLIFTRENVFEPDATVARENRILINSGISEGAIVNKPIVIDGLEQINNAIAFTEKTVFANSKSALVGDIIPICTKGLRVYQNNTSIENILNQTGTFSEFIGADTISTSTTWKLPSADGTINQVLATDGSGNLSFQTEVGTGDVDSALALSNDGFISVSDPANGTKNIRESVALMTSGVMSGLDGISVDGSSQILLETDQAAVDAIKINANGVTSGIEVDATGLIIMDSAIANTQALRFIASDAAGGLLFQSGSGGSEMTSTGAYDWHTSIDMAGEGIKFRATGTQGQIEFDSGSGGCRIVDGGVGLFIDDTGSAFAQQLAVPTFAANIKWTFPSAQGGVGTILSNNGSGVLSWVADGGTADAVESAAALSNDGFVAVSDPGNGTRNIRESQATMTSGVMAGLDGINVDGSSQIELSTDQAAADAIRIEGDGASSGLDVDMTGFIDIDTALANTQALKLTASNVAGGMAFTAGSGGFLITTTGATDILSTQVANSGIKIRATGTNGSIDLTTGTDGVRIINGDTNGMTFEDTGSAFNVNLKCGNSMAASYPIVLPLVQGNAGQVLVNNGSGTLSWENNVGVIRDYQASDFLNSTSSDWQISVLAATIPDDIFNALNVREFLAAADSGVGMKLFVPTGEGGLSVSISWRKDTAAVGTVIWQLFAYNIPNGASISTGTWDVSETISINDPGSDVNTVTTTKNFPLTDLGLTAGESCLLQVVRDVSDTFATSALLMGCTIVEGRA